MQYFLSIEKYKIKLQQNNVPVQENSKNVGVDESD